MSHEEGPRYGRRLAGDGWKNPNLPRWRRRLAVKVEPLRWAAQHPREIARNRGWIAQQLGLGRLNPVVDEDGTRIGYLSPEFLDRYGHGLDDPPVVAASQARHLRDDDTVIGVAVGDEARAYPWWQIDEAHFVNDVIAGQPVVVMLCELCSTGLVLDATVDGRRVLFDHGHHYRGTNTALDRGTRSSWSPYRARAIHGPMAGTELELMPSFQTTWAGWRELHPETTTLDPSVGSREGHGSDQSLGSPGVPRHFRKTIAHWDERLPHNTLVLGVMGASEVRAYPLDDLRNAGGLIEDELGGDPIVVVGSLGEGQYAAGAYRRDVDGEVLSSLVARDWNVDGVAVSGPHEGTRLTFVPSHVSEWFVWAANHPAITLP